MIVVSMPGEILWCIYRSREFISHTGSSQYLKYIMFDVVVEVYVMSLVHSEAIAKLKPELFDSCLLSLAAAICPTTESESPKKMLIF